eukprot:Pgem_evm1s2362
MHPRRAMVCWLPFAFRFHRHLYRKHQACLQIYFHNNCKKRIEKRRKLSKLIIRIRAEKVLLKRANILEIFRKTYEMCDAYEMRGGVVFNE